MSTEARVEEFRDEEDDCSAWRPAVLTKVVSLDVHERRVTEVLEVSNRSLEEARVARRELAAAHYEMLVWKAQAMELAAAYRRLDPVWGRT